MDEADIYSKNKNMQKTDTIYLLENYFRLVKLRPQGDDQILDIGCGDGEISVEILYEKFPKKYQKFIGCDISDNMLEYASKKYAKNKQISFTKLDISCTTLPTYLKDGFHHIFSFYCLHWVQNQTQAMKNIYNLLKPGGDMFVTLVATHPLFTIYKQLETNKKWSKYMTDVKNYLSPYHNVENPSKDFENLLKKTGFSVPLCKIINRVFIFKDMDNLKNSIIAVNPFVNRIPEIDRTDFINDMITLTKNMKFIEQNNNNEENCTVPYHLLVAFAVKPDH